MDKEADHCCLPLKKLQRQWQSASLSTHRDPSSGGPFKLFLEQDSSRTEQGNGLVKAWVRGHECCNGGGSSESGAAAGSRLGNPCLP